MITELRDISDDVQFVIIFPVSWYKASCICNTNLLIDQIIIEEKITTINVS